MPRTHERTFRVRHYECDAYDSVYYTNYLRYIQETAMDASAAAGFGAAWYASRGFVWLVHHTEIEFIGPLRYGDSVRVKTWVRNMRQALSKRAYELYRVGDDTLVARAHTDWAFIDVATGKPARIVPNSAKAFFPEGAPPDEPRERFPRRRSRRRAHTGNAAASSGATSIPRKHVNNSVYLAYGEDCAVEASTALGWAPTRMREEGFSIEMARCRIEYRSPAVLADELVITTWLSGVGETAPCAISRSNATPRSCRGRGQGPICGLRDQRAASFPDAYLNALDSGIATEEKR